MHSMKNYKSLSPVTSEKDFRFTCIPILHLLGPATGQLPSAILEYVVQAVFYALELLKEQNCKNSHITFPECYAKLYSHVLLPSLALARPTLSITEKIWRGLQLFSVKERYRIYADYYFNVKKNIPLLVSSSQAVRRIIGRELKRVTADKSETSGPPVLFTASNAGLSVMGDIVVKQRKKVTHNDKTVMDSLLKLCCANPFEVLDVILHHVKLFDSMLIQVIINYLHKLPDVICDITVFLVTVRQHFLELSEQGAWSPGTLKPKRARNIAHFIARFMRRFQSANVNPLLLSISSRIIKETTSPAYPNKLSGKYCDILFLVELITYMGGVPTLSTEELSSDQVDCIGAGPGLRVMILMDEERRDELYRPGALEARVRLQTALLQKDVFTTLLFGLSKLRLEVQYDCQLLCEERFLQLRSRNLPEFYQLFQK
ncbi:THO complex subunit 2-like [Hylaeus volcanicus]|uniref:THO complex subunit 2-like n=1 Tax=Hylaeus volcanicus TaxID=313075 RepID=UPI0023B83820|nr:THO complex subunit 2-like [Hylaeus volcanicus]